jgi:magnesium chelatase family protein
MRDYWVFELQELSCRKATQVCPCGYWGDPRRSCICTGSQIHRYRSRISGPLLDRIDIHIEVPPVSVRELSLDREEEPSGEIRKRVEDAHQIQQQRFAGRKIYANSRMGTRLIRKHCVANEAARNLLEKVTEKYGLSPRAYHRILKVARTIADLDRKETLEEPHIAEAIQYRVLDKKSAF